MRDFVGLFVFLIEDHPIVMGVAALCIYGALNAVFYKLR